VRKNNFLLSIFPFSQMVGAAMERERSDSSASSSLDVIYCFSHLRWDFVYQRPQHLLSRAAKEARVYYIEEPVVEDGAEPRLAIRQTQEGVMVAVPILPAGLSGLQSVQAQKALVDGLLETRGSGCVFLWYYTPMALQFSRHLTADACIYDNMDELSAFRGAPPRMIALERELFRRADVVFTGGVTLFGAKRHRHANVHAFPSSIDAAHFRKANGVEQPALPDQNHLPRPRLGFFGVIDERTDIDLVAAIADLRPNWQVIMIGPVVKIDPASLPKRPNLHWLGGKRYDELPTYLAGWDVGIMPFALNESTRFISPTKTPEFLAAGVPVVSTPSADVVRPYGELGLVEIAQDPETFAAKAEMLLQRAKDGWLGEVDRHLSTMSWDLTWNTMHRLIDQAAKSDFKPQTAAFKPEVAHV
jgi:glycosyltransferase involved in cell wall biosynthesis